MSEEAVTDASLRQFLLGNVTDEERQQIEALFLTDAEMKERVLEVEEELIDDYLEEALTTEDREQFLLQYGQTPEQQRKLRIAQSIREWAAAEMAEPQSVPIAVSGGSLSTRWRMKPALGISLALAAMILVVASVWLWSLNEQRNRHFAAEQELAQLNSASYSPENPSQNLSLDLSPVAVRSAEQIPEIKPRADVRVVELKLPWVQNDRYSTYQAEVRRADGAELFTIRNLQPVSEPGYAVRVRLPVRMLRRGQYQIRLRGVTEAESFSPVEEYRFSVSE